MWRKRQILQRSSQDEDECSRTVCEHFVPMELECSDCDNRYKTMNREELENFKNKGPCSCNSEDCWYCTAIGDFKFQWVIARAERNIYANQLERSLEIAQALSEHAVIAEGSFDWREVLKRLISEVKGEKNASEV